MDDSWHYFRRIRSALLAAGFETFHSNVGWGDPVEARAGRLRREILRLTRDFQLHDKVHIIGHSMGGLDARRMIFRHRMEDRVASLTTIGTPHLGTVIADLGIGRLEAVIPMIGALGLDISGLADLTTQRCRAFNEEADAFERSNGVKYQTYAGCQERSRVYSMLKLTYDFILSREGPNDGLVSVDSARWREDVHVRDLDADHLNQIGWCDTNEPEYRTDREGFERRMREVYLEIARGL